MLRKELCTGEKLTVAATSVHLVVSTLNSLDKYPRRLPGIIYSHLLNGRLLFRSFCRSTVAVASYIRI